MKTIKKIAQFKPLIDNCPHGTEPNLEYIIRYYYTSHNIEFKKAEYLKDEYIKELEKYYND